MPRAVRELVPRHPWTVLVVTIVVTGVLGWFASQAVVEDGVAVENRSSEALDVLDERFGDPRSVLQVLFRTTDGRDVRNADALATSRDIQQRILDGPLADTLLERGGQPPLVSYLAAAEQAVEQAGIDPAGLDDGEVRELQQQGEEALPPRIADLLDEALADGDPPQAGLLLVFQDTEGLDEEQVLDQQRQLADLVRDVAPPAGLEVAPLAIELLLENEDIGPEIGRLFGTALAIILLVLGVVYWLRPAGVGRGRVLRRTLADVGLTLVAILFAVVWMQGIGVLLGPDRAGLIGAFDSQTQVVPILVVALGVDFAIHLFARYRTETGQSGEPATGYVRAFRTVGVALLLDATATAIGFLTNLFSPVQFLATLGVLAASGILAAFVLTMTFLPAARLLLDRRATRRDRLPREALTASSRSTLPRVVGRGAWLAERAPVATLVVAAALTGVGIYGFTQLDSRFELTDFVPQDDPQLATFEVLQEEFDGGFGQTTQVLMLGELATPEAHAAHLESLERAAEVEEVDALDEAAAGTTLRTVLAEVADDDELAGALQELGLQPDGTVADDADVAAIYEQLLTDLPTASEVLDHGDDGWAARANLRTRGGQDEALRLREGLQEAFAPLRDEGVTAVPASQELVQASVSEEIEQAQLLSIVVALGAVMLLLAIFFGVRRRQPLVGVLTVLPVGFVLALTFGLMALTDIPLNPVTATLAALSIGIGVPFTIHVSTRYLEERDAHPDDALRRAVGQTGGAVIGSALTTAIGFGVLTTSTLLPFEQLGYVIVYAIVLSGVAATLVLPSLLALWERRQRRA